jgi:hypothetical protein
VVRQACTLILLHDFVPAPLGPFSWEEYTAGGPDEVTQNDSTDADGGPNNLQNFPILTSASIFAVRR